jgi:hypothetical protein
MTDKLYSGDLECLRGARTAPLQWDAEAKPHSTWRDSAGKHYFRARVTRLIKWGYLKTARTPRAHGQRQAVIVSITDKGAFLLHRKETPNAGRKPRYPAWLPVDLRREFDAIRTTPHVTRSMAEDHCRVLMRRRAAAVSATPRLEAAE